MVDIFAILGKIGFDWQVALANLVNFLLVLFVLRRFAFKPIKKIIDERRAKINEGLEKAREAGARLLEIDSIAKSKLQETDAQSLEMIREAKERAKKIATDAALQAEVHRQKLLKQAEIDYQNGRELARQNILKEASQLITMAIIKAVELKPEHIDEALIQKAAKGMKYEA